MILEAGDYLVGGEIETIDRIVWEDGLNHYRLTPNEIRAKLKEMNADCVFAFQVRFLYGKLLVLKVIVYFLFLAS